MQLGQPAGAHRGRRAVAAGQQQARLLALVRLVSLYREQVVAVTEDGDNYYFPPDCAAPCRCMHRLGQVAAVAGRQRL